MKTPTPTQEGAPNATALYIAVGVALSWWESSEDVLMGVFSRLCAEQEPTAFESYVAAPRAVRGKMLVSALNRYKHRFTDAERREIKDAMKRLDDLAWMRNQIAHGHVSYQTRTIDDVLVLSGDFLVPSLNEHGHQVQRDLRYAHTDAEIDAWREKVRAQRRRVMDAQSSAMQREQAERQAMPVEVQDTLLHAALLINHPEMAAGFEVRPRKTEGDEA